MVVRMVMVMMMMMMMVMTMTKRTRMMMKGAMMMRILEMMRNPTTQPRTRQSKTEYFLKIE